MNVHFCSTSDEWATPQAIYDLLHGEFDFDLDPCATAENAKCPAYFTAEQDGLALSWAGARAFCNPPYSKLYDWTRKCLGATVPCEAEGQFAAAKLAVMLIPARTDTRAWQDFIFPHASEVRFLRGRLRFGNAKTGAPFPSAVVVFRRRWHAPLRPAECGAWDVRGLLK